MKLWRMMCINFNVALSGLRGMLQHIFLIASTSQTMCQMPLIRFSETYGRNASLCSILAYFNFHLIGLMGMLQRLFTCYWLAQSGAAFIRNLLTVALVCLHMWGTKNKRRTVAPSSDFAGLFLQSYCPYFSLCWNSWGITQHSHVTHLQRSLSVSVIRLQLLFLPCLEVEPWALVRRWRTESGLWWRVESWKAWKVLMDKLVKEYSEEKRMNNS